jgi:energy-coupling factor transporter ATP-binding protein EcfA2
VNDPRALLEHVSYAYPRRVEKALDDVSVAVGAGEVTALMGKTGAGKTTTLALLNGLIPDFYEGTMEGSVRCDGLDTRLYHVQTLARTVGLVLQDTETQILGLTVESDAAFGPCNLGLPREEILRSVSESLWAVGLTGLERRHPATLSGGEKQRLAIAGILAMKPSVLGMDEPTAELDPVGRRQVYDLCRGLKSTGEYTIIIATHDSDDVLGLADTVVVLDDGHIAWSGKPADLFSDVARCVRAGIRPPVAAELFTRLRRANLVPDQEVPLTVGSFLALLPPLLKAEVSRAQQPVPIARPITSVSPAIEIEALHHRYDGGGESLRGVSLAIEGGDFVAIVGRNGAGKSTLAKHLNGLLLPTSGSVRVKGMDTRSSPTSVLSRTVGYVFQNPDHQIFCPTVREELEFGLERAGMLTRNEIAERVHSALALVGLQDAVARHPFTLGKGERQKLALASVLAIAPSVLVVDEPTTGLDWEGTCAMMDLFHRLNADGHTIIIITHDMQLAADHADRIVVMGGGTVMADGMPTDIFLQPDLLARASLVMPPSGEIALGLWCLGLDVQGVRMCDIERTLVAALGGSFGHAH